MDALRKSQVYKQRRRYYELLSTRWSGIFGDSKNSQMSEINKDLTRSVECCTMMMLTSRTIMSTINDTPPWL